MKVRPFVFVTLFVISNHSEVLGQERFGLERFVESALQHNADILAARQRQQEATGVLRQAGLRPNPALDVEVSNGAILGSRGEHDFSVEYAHTFETGNKRKFRIAAAEPGRELARLEAADRERRIRGEVGQAYVEALAAHRSLEVFERLAALNQQCLRVAQARVDQGEAAPVERGLLQAEFSRIETDRLRVEADSSRALLALKNLAGMPLDTEVLLDGDLNTRATDFTLTALLERALADRPDLRAVRAEEEMREAELQLAHAERIPNVVGYVRYAYKAARFDQVGVNSSGLSVPLADHDNVLSGGISLDLMTRNRNQGVIEAAMARVATAKYHTASVTQLIEREVRTAVQRYEAARRAVGIFDTSLLSQSQDNLNAVRAAYEAGELRVFDLLFEQRRLVETQRAYVDAVKEFRLSRVELERAVGGSVQ
jgi:cobalt-zinc-cadmium efflux system outer membrane protein